MFNDKELFQLAEALVAGNEVDTKAIPAEQLEQFNAIVKDLKDAQATDETNDSDNETEEVSEEA